MPVPLVIAHAGDPLAREFVRLRPLARWFRLTGGRTDAQLTLHFDSQRLGLSIRHQGAPMHSGEVSSLLMRPPPQRPPLRSPSPLQAFRSHEWRAFWPAWLLAQPVPVFNRFGPDWFLDSRNCQMRLTWSLARALGVPVAARTTGRHGCRDGSPGAALRLHVVDGEALTARAAGANAMLAGLEEKLHQWASSEGMGLFALELQIDRGGPALIGVDPAPRLPPGSSQLHAVANALARRLP